jgi:hypothetical protein
MFSEDGLSKIMALAAKAPPVEEENSSEESSPSE